jgi:hypothetical protein
MDTSIEFSAILDWNGKLIVGRSRKIISKTEDHKIMNPTILNRCDHPNNGNIFCSELNKLLIFSIDDSSLEDYSSFEVICVSKSSYIAFTPINENQDKYLCIYFQSNLCANKTLVRLNSMFN